MSAPPVQDRRRGFTLVEIMAVVVIIGLGVFVTAMVTFDAPPKYRLESGAKKIGSIFRRARTRAISSDRPFLVEFQDKSRLIRLYPKGEKQETNTTPADGGGSGNDSVTEGNDSKRFPIVYTLPEGVRIQNVTIEGANDPGEKSHVMISPSGLIPSHAIRLTGENDLQTTVVPNPATGTIRYQEDSPSQKLVITDHRPAPK